MHEQVAIQQVPKFSSLQLVLQLDRRNDSTSLTTHLNLIRNPKRILEFKQIA